MVLASVPSMATHKYKINETFTGGFKKTVDADHFRLENGYFYFYEGFGQNAEVVFAIEQAKAHTVEREK